MALPSLPTAAAGCASSADAGARRTNPSDPREFTQRYLSFCLFYRGGALKMRGLLAESLEGVDRDLLYPAVERLLRNDDGRARSALESVYRHLTLEELGPLLPAIVRAIEEPFSSSPPEEGRT